MPVCKTVYAGVVIVTLLIDHTGFPGFFVFFLPHCRPRHQDISKAATEYKTLFLLKHLNLLLPERGFKN